MLREKLLVFLSRRRREGRRKREKQRGRREGEERNKRRRKMTGCASTETVTEGEVKDV